jgi:hypothetical protein
VPRAFNPATQTALNSGRIVDRRLALFDLVEKATSTQSYYGFWTGVGPFSYNGVTYTGAGSLLEIDAIRQTSDLSAVQVIGRLTGIPNSSLTPDVLATVENYHYHQRPVTLSIAYFDPVTYGLLAVEVEYRGIIDRILHKESDDGAAVLEVHLESRFRDHLKSGYRMRSVADQWRVDPTDDGLRHVTQVVNEQVIFGRAQQTTTSASLATPPAKKKSFWDRIFG